LFCAALFRRHMSPAVIRTEAFARAGLVGNPSDGYFGKTISFIIRNYSARIELTESRKIEIVPNERDHSSFESLDELVADVGLYGYYGGLRLLKATAKRFFETCREREIQLHDRCFRLKYHSTIPARVGMAGSSAIITACLRALMKFYGVTDAQLHKPKMPNLILAVENEELGIPAGLQDRVIQVYEGAVFMDFDEGHMKKEQHGRYEEIDPKLLPPLYVAYQAKFGEGTEVPHSDLRKRWLAGDAEVHEAMKQWATLAQQTRDMLIAKKGREIAPLLNANFDLRRRIMGDKISPDHVRMVDAARKVGCSAKFTGSGGAIVGTYEDERMYERLVEALRPLGVTVCKPQILPRPGKL
jgi:glucuronokinase